MPSLALSDLCVIWLKFAHPSYDSASQDNAFGLLRVGPPADDKSAAEDKREAASEGDQVSGDSQTESSADVATPAAPAGETLMFEAADIVPGSPNPVLGSQVKFLLSTHIRSKQKRAVQVEVTAPPPKPAPKPGRQRGGAPEGHVKERDMGVVVTAKESFGFIRPLNQEKPEVFFHYSELTEVRTPSVHPAPAPHARPSLWLSVSPADT